jgi:hypothetical protein
MKRHPIYTILIPIEVVLYIFFITVAVWELYPYQTIVFSDIPIAGAHVVNSPLYPGDAIKYKLSFCKKTNETAIVHRILVDGEFHILPDIAGSLPVACGKDITVITTNVPDTAVPGRYYLDVADEFHPNPIRSIIVRYHTDYFDVIARPISGTDLIGGVPTPIIITATTTKK